MTKLGNQQKGVLIDCVNGLLAFIGTELAGEICYITHVVHEQRRKEKGNRSSSGVFSSSSHYAAPQGDSASPLELPKTGTEAYESARQHVDELWEKVVAETNNKADNARWFDLPKSAEVQEILRWRKNHPINIKLPGDKPAASSRKVFCAAYRAVLRARTILAAKTERVAAVSARTEQVAAPSKKTEKASASSKKTEKASALSKKTEQVAAPSKKTEKASAPSKKTEKASTPSKKTEKASAPSKMTEQVAAPSKKTEKGAAPPKKKR
uniref:Uncharacterized protein n=1 Tax=Chromera velia CCMP2878 TaxID=1169474 RepID=A0A0G4H3K9_9ALVE|eukprot:Cvel_24567.t1-p1 / transcript=Cvel_24567.t1 / gene=Cvel_24567 / organism=Chromera_velia_CCMP2878 / gene_product=hypothetical protein / transcript_product=hypothetical protein / location=Cvel_scaffold2672:24518-25771(-) / protein_length=266 / sequence_SO=supercontig / SO=protein_coding / is_pseudo=false